MKAVTVEPGIAASVRFEEVPEPDESNGSILVEAVAVGLCGTDVEIASGEYGWAPPGRKRLILGHESLGRVLDPGPVRSVKAGDLIVGIVRRPDPVPCPNCAVGEWDMCRNGQYTERGIKEIDGFMSERWRIEADYFTKVNPSLGLLAVLLEPTTVVAKAWELVAGMRARAFWEPRRALITGAGPIGMLAAMIGVRAGLDVHVLDRVTEGAKPQLVHDVGATYHSGAVADVGFQPDIVIECTGVGSVIVDRSAPSALVGWSVSQAWAAVDRRAGSRRPTWQRRWSSRTTLSSARSTPTVDTSTRLRRRWRPPTGRGWSG